MVAQNSMKRLRGTPRAFNALEKVCPSGSIRHLSLGATRLDFRVIATRGAARSFRAVLYQRLDSLSMTYITCGCDVAHSGAKKHRVRLRSSTLSMLDQPCGINFSQSYLAQMEAVEIMSFRATQTRR